MGKLLGLAAVLMLSGCASFNSGDVLAPRTELRRMLADRDIRPFAQIRVAWKNFPYKNPTDTIGEGVIDPPKPRPVPVSIKDAAWLTKRAKAIFSEAGLYDAERGSGTLRISLISYGRWTYGEIFRSFLVDTGYIFLIPASLRVNYQLVAEYAGPGGKTAVEEIGRNKTTFHALILPLYPLFSPGAKERALLKNMLWKAATDVYAGIKRPDAGGHEPPGAPASLNDGDGVKEDDPEAVEDD